MNIFRQILKLYTQSIEGLSRKVWMIAGITLVNRAGSMVLPFLTLYLEDGLSFTKSSVAIVAFCYGLGSLIGSFAGGVLTDRFGAYKVASGSLIFSSFAFLGFLMSTDFTFLCVWSILALAITDCYRPAIMVSIGEYCDEKTLTRGISLTRMAMNLGVSVGPLIGGLLVVGLGYHWLFVVDGITCFIAGLLFLKHFKPKTSEPKQVKKRKMSMIKAITDLPFMFFMVFNLLNLLAFFQIIESLPLFINDNGYSALYISVFFFFNGFAIFVIELPIVHYLEQKYRPLDCAIGGVFLIGLAYVCLYFVPHFWLAIALYSIFVVLGEIINFPFVTSIAHKRAGVEEKGSYMGAISLMFSLSFLIAPFGLNIVDHYGYSFTWLIMIFLSLLSIAGLLLLRRWLNRQSLPD